MRERGREGERRGGGVEAEGERGRGSTLTYFWGAFHISHIR